MPKKIVFIWVMILSWTLCADYAASMAEAKKAAEAKDIETAAARYLEAEKSAPADAQWFNAIWSRHMLYRASNKSAGAVSVLKEALESSKLSPPNRRKVLNNLGALLLWSNQDETLLYLSRAMMIPTPTVNDRSETYLTQAYLYAARQRPEYAVDILQKVINDRETHPANMYTAYLLIGGGYRAAGRKEEAAENFRLAVEYAKKIQYKFDYSAAEKALREINQ